VISYEMIIKNAFGKRVVLPTPADAKNGPPFWYVHYCSLMGNSFTM